MSSPETGLVTTTPQASLVLLDAHPDPRIGGPSANTTTVVRHVVAAAMPNGALIWDAISEQFHLYTDSGLFGFRRHKVVWPDGTTLRGEDVAMLLARQVCESVPTSLQVSVPSLAGQGRVLSFGDDPGASGPAGWQQPGFDDSAWPAAILEKGGVYGTVGGTQNITVEDGWLFDERFWLHRRHFTLPPVAGASVQYVASAQIEVNVDNYLMGLWVNGVQEAGAFSLHNGDGSFSVPAAACAVGGDNVLAAAVWNDASVGPTSISYLLTVHEVAVLGTSTVVPSSAFAAQSPVSHALLRSAVPQELPDAPPGTLAVLRLRHADGTPVAEGDGEQWHLRTTEGWFSFRGNCITFPHGQMLCGEELCPPMVPLTWHYSLSGGRTQTPWNDTGIDLPSHSDVLFAARGSICGFQGGGCHGPDGNGLPAPAGFTGHGFYLVPGLIRYSLIGKIGEDGSPFQVGSSATAPTVIGGRLFLSVNDDNQPDNSGDWEVVITLLDEGQMAGRPHGLAGTSTSGAPTTLTSFDPTRAAPVENTTARDVQVAASPAGTPNAFVGDASQARIRTLAGFFKFIGDCLYFPWGQRLCSAAVRRVGIGQPAQFLASLLRSLGTLRPHFSPGLFASLQQAGQVLGRFVPGYFVGPGTISAVGNLLERFNPGTYLSPDALLTLAGSIATRYIPVVYLAGQIQALGALVGRFVPGFIISPP